MKMTPINPEKKSAYLSHDQLQARLKKKKKSTIMKHPTNSYQCGYAIQPGSLNSFYILLIKLILRENSKYASKPVTLGRYFKKRTYGITGILIFRIPPKEII